MSEGRRGFLAAAGLLGAAATLPALGREQKARRLPRIKPPRLREGDRVGVVAPAFAPFLEVDVDVARESLEAMGLRVSLGANLRDRYGYLAGPDTARAADVNAFFADPELKAVAPIGGGWGTARMLPYVDFESIRKHPKVFFGFSDITALHSAIQAQTGLVTFHSPNAFSSWSPFSLDFFRRVVFEGEAVLMQNPVDTKESLVAVKDRIRTITPGVARGRLLGGNLSVLSALMGSAYVPDFGGAILFLEDVEEEIYRIDRMLTTLQLAGVLRGISGFVFGHCTKCGPGERYGSLTLEEVLDDHVKALGVPAFAGAMIGHIAKQFTLPIGGEVEVDADQGTLRMLEPGVA
jgi:muramoyltetrapeptide carboxypeptidase